MSWCVVLKFSIIKQNSVEGMSPDNQIRYIEAYIPSVKFQTVKIAA